MLVTTAAAAAAGSLAWDQALALVRSLDALPDDLDPELAEIAEAEEARALAEEERQARRVTRLSFRPRGDGSTDIHARLPAHVASRLRTYLDAFTSPRRSAPFGDVDSPRCRGGGARRSVPCSSRSLPTAYPCTAALPRRLACTASILPVVLGGAGEVLDLGRARRLFSSGQRKAMAIRDCHCRAEGCDIQAAWCEAHHATTPWSRGGGTDLADGALLCSFHHRRAHDPAWPADRLPNGDVRYARRT